MTRPRYVPIARQFFETRWLRTRVFSPEEAWIDCIQLARYAGGEHPLGVTLSRGQFTASYSWLAQRWSWSIKQVRIWIQGAQLRADLRAEQRAQPGAQTPTVYTLVEYEQWNTAERAEGTVKGTEEGTDQGTVEGTNIRNRKKGIKKDSAGDQLVVDMLTAWTEQMGGTLNFGRVKKEIKSLLDLHPPEKILTHWQEYFRKNQREEDRKYLSITAFVNRFGLYVPAGELSLIRGGQSDDEQYAFLVGEAQRGMDMANTTKYPDWAQYRDRYWRGEKPKRGTLRSAG